MQIMSRNFDQYPVPSQGARTRGSHSRAWLYWRKWKRSREIQRICSKCESECAGSKWIRFIEIVRTLALHLHLIQFKMLSTFIESVSHLCIFSRTHPGAHVRSYVECTSCAHVRGCRSCLWSLCFVIDMPTRLQLRIQWHILYQNKEQKNALKRVWNEILWN